MWLIFIGSFVVDGDTRAGELRFERYDCGTQAEMGPEVAFPVVLDEESDVDLVVEGDGDGVDVDVHLLASLDPTDCIVRGNKNAAAFHLAAGTYFAVIDTYGPDAKKAGPFRLWVNVYPTAGTTWTEIGRGVRWGRASHQDSSGAFSTTNTIDVDPALARVEVYDHGACRAKLPDDTIAAINAGFFKDDCAPENLLRVGGVTIQAPSGVETVLRFHGAVAAISDGDAPSESAVGGRGFFDATSFRTDSSGTSFHQSRHPRSLFVLGADGHQRLVAIDGRTDAGAGLSFTGIQSLLAGETAINLDGGGSTSMFVRGQPMGGVVNYPSDNQLADHEGLRAVRSLLVVRGEPIDRVHFSTLPPPVSTLHDGDVLTYRPRAFVRGGTPVITVTPEPGATYAAGTLRYAPSVGAGVENGPHNLRLEACHNGLCVTQQVPVIVELSAAEAPVVPPPVPTPVQEVSETSPSADAAPAGRRPREVSETSQPVRPGCDALGASGWWLGVVFFLRDRQTRRAAKLHDGHRDDDGPGEAA